MDDMTHVDITQIMIYFLLSLYFLTDPADTPLSLPKSEGESETQTLTPYPSYNTHE